MIHVRMPARLAGALLALIVANTEAATITRSSAFEYDATTGVLTKEIIEPDNPQLRVETAYTYDAFGNKVAATVFSPATGAAAVAPRSTTTGYDCRGQYPTTSSNAIGQSETRVYDPRFGAITSLTPQAPPTAPIARPITTASTASSASKPKASTAPSSTRTRNTTARAG